MQVDTVSRDEESQDPLLSSMYRTKGTGGGTARIGRKGQWIIQMPVGNFKKFCNFISLFFVFAWNDIYLIQIIFTINNYCAELPLNCIYNIRWFIVISTANTMWFLVNCDCKV